jgi:hypothetical protein
MEATHSNEALHQFSKVSIDENCEVISGHHENELFFNCTFKKLNGLTLKDCDLNRSTFKTSDVRDALNFTMTLNCHSFNNVSFSPLLFDLMLVLLLKTNGNTEKRQALIEVIGKERVIELLQELKSLE